MRTRTRVWSDVKGFGDRVLYIADINVLELDAIYCKINMRRNNKVINVNRPILE